MVQLITAGPSAEAGVVDTRTSDSAALDADVVDGLAGGTAGLVGGRRFGLAHVDLMDLHIERVAGGPPRREEVLSGQEIAERFAQAGASGAKWNRWSLYWDLVDVGDGFDWSVADEIVARDHDAGLASLLILQGTPERHATAGSPDLRPPSVGGHLPGMQLWSTWRGGASVQSSPPRGLYEPVFLSSLGVGTDDPLLAFAVNPANPWAVFVAAAVERYKPGGLLATRLGWPASEGVRAWEIGNEPNIPFFWSGTPEEYSRYLEVAYLATVWRDPEATVMHGGIADAPGAQDWFERFLDGLLTRSSASPLPERYGYYFDASAWHWYAYPDLLRSGPERVREVLRERGLAAKPIWVTEMGVPIWSEHPGPCWDPLSPWRATLAEQASYVWQAIAEGVAAGIEVMFVFQAYDDCGNGPESYDAFGLVRNHASNQCWKSPQGKPCWRFDPALAGKPRPAHAALRVVADALGDAELLWRPGRHEAGWQRLLLYRPPAERVTVAWSWTSSAQSVELTATGRSGRLYELDSDGFVTWRDVAAEAGKYVVDLPGATNRNRPEAPLPLMAGRPVILVERDIYAPFRARVDPLPETSPTRFELTVAAADGGTGVRAVRVLVAEEPPQGEDDWAVHADRVPWTARAVAGSVKVTFEG